MAKLQETLETEFGKRYIQNVKLPDYFETGINPSKRLRPYQVACFQYFLTYMDPENPFDGKATRPHLLFHMATGSGKTLQMAGTMLYLYEHGYRNFLFFVGSTNIVEKTRDNFLNTGSAKYMFAPTININGRRVEIKEVKNFQGVGDDCINLCLSTIQGLHSDLNTEKENALTYEDFSAQPVVLIADEAHHLNAATKRKQDLTKEEQEELKNWEATINNIFLHDNGILPNVLLEFTATMDLANPSIAAKYEDKIIFDYDLKKFREDGFSKDVETFETDADAIDRALQAIILSQYKRKLFGELKLSIKPVVMLKSKTIDSNKVNYEAFRKAMAGLTPSSVQKIRNRAKDDLKKALDYFTAKGISDDNLILELQEDFSDERLLLIDGKNITPEKQRLLNSLENEHNEIRAIFAVDMLNEGWDVLNLYDIVRLYDTNDSKNGLPGKTTMQEAQLIGRGARYMPFTNPVNPSLDADKRKYDDDAGNPYKVIEKLHYHSLHDPKYISALKNGLRRTGIIPENRIQCNLFLKEDFKQSRLYKKGLVFMNERKPLAVMDDDGTIGKEILNKVFKVRMHTGKMRSGQVFGDSTSGEVLTSLTIPAFDFIKIGKAVIRSAMNNFSTFSYRFLYQLYPQLKSCAEFVASESYLAKLQVSVTGRYLTLDECPHDDRLYIAKEVLKQIEPVLLTRGKSFRGTRLFSPKMLSSTFRDKIVLNINVQTSGSQEYGRPQSSPANQDYAIDLNSASWYAYNENYGTSEEKALVKYIEGIMPELRTKYDEVCLIRSEKDVKIFSFDEGRPFEPDFILFLRVKGADDRYDNLQIFIESKGNQLLKEDKWKNDFLQQIAVQKDVRLLTKSDQFYVWGLPFFNEGSQKPFINAFEDSVLNYTNPVSTITSSEVSPSHRYTTHLPVYPLRAACGYFDENGSLPEEEAEGWIDVTGQIRKPNESMFIIHAEGRSMEPLIHDGDLCVFDHTGGGSNNGKIVLVKAKDGSDPDASSYTIKKYSSKKIDSNDGSWRHTHITLFPLNPEFQPIELDADQAEGGEFGVYGELVKVIEKKSDRYGEQK